MKHLVDLSMFCGLNHIAQLNVFAIVFQGFVLAFLLFLIICHMDLFTLSNDLSVRLSSDINLLLDNAPLFPVMHEANSLARGLNYDLRKLMSGHFRGKCVLMQSLLNTANRLKKFSIILICYEE